MKNLSRCGVFTIAVSSFLAGCTHMATNKLEATNGTGAIAIPISIVTNSESKKYPCRSLELVIKKTFVDPSDLNEGIKEEIYVGKKPTYSLITNLAPGDYSVGEYRCYANYRRVFNDSKSYLTSYAGLSFEVKADQVLILKKGFEGSVDYDAVGGSSFNYGFYSATGGQKESIKETMTNQGLPAGWTIVEQQ
ncbi:hypothetical protein [Enterovibrio norvegicus]|uniref:hypothetical protein n=1 Tax=Enterovibrio norvegicus TaxID=188144 RepID=UPI000C85B372|nr:hypothetical protein [Enterovibrio norvegicus]PMN70540.1 hypothetical protein BCT27_02155 [Enterovibrio norvegicus]